MPRPAPAVNHAMGAQVALRALRRACAPVWTAALASGSWSLMAESQALAATVRTAGVQLRRITGELDAIACPDGAAVPGHGRAA